VQNGAVQGYLYYNQKNVETVVKSVFYVDGILCDIPLVVYYFMIYISFYAHIVISCGFYI